MAERELDHFSKFNNMKWLIYGFMLLSTSMFSQASSYQDFEWDVLQVGYANASDLTDTKSGFLFGTEIRYNAKDACSIGLEMDFSLFLTDVDDDGDNFDMSTLSTSSIFIDQYSQTTSNNRFFYGLGLGQITHSIIPVRDGESNGSIYDFSAMAISPRIGYEWKYVRFSAKYVISTKKEVSNYIGCKLGFTLWGKYNKK